MKVIIFFLSATLFLSSCVPSKVPDVLPNIPTLKPSSQEEQISVSPTTQPVSSFADLLFPSSIRYPEWTIVDKDIDMKEFKIEYEDGSLQDIIAVVRIKPTRTLRIWQDQTSPKMIDAWQVASGASIIINGSFFQEDSFATTGFIFLAGDRFGSFRKPYNGLVQIGEQLSLQYLPSAQFSLSPTTKYALTSYPMLIHEGVVVTTGNSDKESRRTVIATSSLGEVFFIVTQRFSYTLNDLAQWIVSGDFKIQEALNLDGGGSTGLAVVASSLRYVIPNFDPVPNVVGVVGEE